MVTHRLLFGGVLTAAVLAVIVALLLVWNTGDVAQGATTINVTKNADTEGICTPTDCSVREAIAAAAPGDSIDIPLGLYTLTLGKPLEITKDLTINGDFIILQGDPAKDTKEFRLMDITAGDVRIGGDIVIRNGGGITVGAAATVTLTNIIFRDNKPSCTANDGGISNDGTLTLVDSTVASNRLPRRHNHCGVSGGGIFNSATGTLTLVRTTVSNNFVRVAGGGIWNLGTVTMTDSTVANNEAEGSTGGGIGNNGGSMTITDSTVSGNKSWLQGGGIFTDATITMTNSTVSGNTSRGADGGGIRNDGTLRITNSTVSANKSNTSRSGGGISNGGTLLLTNSTVTANNAGTVGGGGIHNFNGVVLMTNTILAGNTAPTGPDCIGLPIRSNDNNLIGNDKDCDFTAKPTDQVGTEGIPIGPKLGPLQDNGGPTFTHALLPGSPAIDAGNDAKAPATDQRGVRRPQGAASDIGSFEVGGLNTPPMASNQLVGTTLDTPVAIKLKASDVDTEDTLVFTITSLPVSGDLSEDGTPIDTVPHELEGDMVTYTPDAGVAGSDSFDFKANDGTVDSNIATVTVFVVARANAVPLAFDDRVETTVDTPVSIELDGVDADGDPLSFIITSLPGNGDLSEDGTPIDTVPHELGGDMVTYTPDTGVAGSDTFDFKVNDGTVDSDEDATVTVDVIPLANNTPVAFDATVETMVGTPVPIKLDGHDDDGGPLTFILTSLPDNGDLFEGATKITTTPHVLDGDTVLYIPGPGFEGTDGFSFKVNDGTVDSDEDATVTVDVTPPLHTVTGTARLEGMPNPIAGARIAFSTNSTVAEVTSDPQDGSFEVQLPAGTYDITVEKDGFLPARKTDVVVNQDMTLPEVLLLWGDTGDIPIDIKDLTTLAKNLGMKESPW